MLAIAFGGHDVPGRNLLIGLATWGEWVHFGAQESSVGVFAGSDRSPLRLPLVLFSGQVPKTFGRVRNMNEGMSGTTTLRHEIAHLVTASFIPHEPHWFAEGIAVFFEGARFDPA